MKKQNKFNSSSSRNINKRILFQFAFLIFLLIITNVNGMIVPKNNNSSFIVKGKTKVIITVKGKVTDEKGIPLEGVIVLLMERAKVVKTNKDGQYTIAANINENLEFSNFGFKNKTIKVSKEILNVKLKKSKNKKSPYFK